jgi:hypothetical protein
MEKLSPFDFIPKTIFNNKVIISRQSNSKQKSANILKPATISQYQSNPSSISNKYSKRYYPFKSGEIKIQLLKV